MIGSSMRDLVWPDDHPKLDALLQRAAQRNCRGEIRLKSRKGAPLPVHLSLNPLRFNSTRGVCLIASDLSEVKRAEQALRASSEQFRNLAAHLLSVREEERAKISREVHDELGQSLTAVKMDLAWLVGRLPQGNTQMLNRIRCTGQLADSIIQAIRKISTELRLKELKAEWSGLPVLVLSAHPEDQFALRALKAGAGGYMTKESAPEELAKAIRKIMAGGRYVSPALAEKLALGVTKDLTRTPHETLSDREYDVMSRIASGKTVTEIAEELSLSPKTISTYRSRVLLKTERQEQCRNRTVRDSKRFVDLRPRQLYDNRPFGSSFSTFTFYNYVRERSTTNTYKSFSIKPTE